MDEDEYFRIYMASLWPDLVRQKFSEIGLDFAALLALPHQSGWSVIVQCHALVETTLNEVLNDRLDERALHNVIARLQMRTKIQMLKALCGERPTIHNKRRTGAALAWSSWQWMFRFIDVLSALRNRCAHNFKHVGASLKQLMAELTESELRTLLPSSISARDDRDSAAALVAQTTVAVMLLILWQQTNESLRRDTPSDVRQEVFGNSLAQLRASAEGT